MKFPLFLSVVLCGSLALRAQNKDVNLIAQMLPDDQILSPLKYLASDRLKGRNIGLPEIDSAAEYIAHQLQKCGAKPIGVSHGYYQEFTIVFDHRYRVYRDNPQAAANLPVWSTTRGISLKNIVAFVQGTDLNLRDQYILLSAH